MPLTSRTAPAPPLSRKPRDDEIDCCGLTHQGKVRKTNNDHFLIAALHKRMDVMQTSLPDVAEASRPEERVAFFAMLADGVGGGETGEEASRIALDTVTDYLTTGVQAYYGAEDREGALEQALREAAARSHASVLKRARERDDDRTRATTLTLLVGVWPWVYLLQVGDSRYYIYRDGVLTQITRDQTYAQDLVDAGVITPAQAEGSPLKNVLSSSIGGDNTDPVVHRLVNHWNNVHFFCSDGLTKHVSDERIRERIAAMTTSQKLCEDLLQDALDGGGSDNITIICGRFVPGEETNDSP